MTLTDSQCYQTTSGTSLTGTVSANVGDIIVATITTRDTTTIPAGWTQLHYSGVFDVSFGNGQRMYVICKEVDTQGTVSLTITQATAQRLYINLISVSGAESVAYYNSKIETGISISVPDKPAGATMIWACSCAYWNTTAPYGAWATSPNDLTLVSLDQATTQPRNGNFVDFGNGAATGRTITQANSTAYPAAIAAVRLFPPALPEYKPSGSAVFASTEIQAITDYATSKIIWQATEPTGTTVKLYAAISSTAPLDPDYAECTNFAEIPGISQHADLSTKTLYVKAVLATTGPYLTPSLAALSFEMTDTKYTTFVPAAESGKYKITCDISDRPHGITVMNKKTSRLRFSSGEVIPVFSVHMFIAGMVPYIDAAYAYDKANLYADFSTVTEAAPVFDFSIYDELASITESATMPAPTFTTNENFNLALI